jgi:hypothetical protein
MFSLNHLKLSYFIICLEESNSLKKVWYSFYEVEPEYEKTIINYNQTEEKLFNEWTIKKEERKENNSKLYNKENKSPLFNKIQKREFHTNKCSQFNSKKFFHNLNILFYPSKDINKIIKSSESFNYLNTIKEIINNNEYSPIEAQKLIENNWMDIIYDKLNNSKYLTDKYSQNLNNKILEANERLEIQFKDRYFIKKFPYLIDLKSKNIKYLLIAFSIIISNYHKDKYTNLSMKVGERIIDYLIELNKKKN